MEGQLSVQDKESVEITELSEQQELFCLEYVRCLNAKQAALKAGYSEKTAGAQGSRLLKSVKIQARCQELNADRKERTLIDADRILKELLDMAMVDISEAFNDDGSLKPIREIPKPIRRMISSLEINELFEGFGKEREQIGHVKKLRFWSKEKALELLGKHLKLFTDKVEHSGKVTLEELVMGSHEDEE